ncbi:ATP-grasp domain-containing protein [Marinobacteraceae bacterium S3BR75-40.1]
MTQTLWVVGGGVETIPGIQRAKAMGLTVVVSDGSASAPALASADHSVIMDTYDAEGTLSAAREFAKRYQRIDGILCIGSDVPFTVAYVAHHLGLPGLSPETARLSSNKLDMKQRLQQAGIPLPWYQAINSEAALREVLSSRPGKYVLKPLDSRGARGVVQIDANSDLATLYQHSISQSPGGRVMLEEYLDGPQISTEAVLMDGQGYPVGFTDRNYDKLDYTYPFIIENGGGFPSVVIGDDKTAVENTAIEAGKALGVETGIVKGDMVLTAEGPKVIEIATRLSGGWFSTDQIPLGYGIDLVGVAIDLALGHRVDPARLQPKWQQGVSVRFFFPPPGRLKAIHQAREVAEAPWLYKQKFYVQPGDHIVVPKNHTERSGFVITTGETAAIAHERAETAVAATQFDVEGIE